MFIRSINHKVARTLLVVPLLIFLVTVAGTGCGGDPAKTTVSRGGADIIGTVTGVQAVGSEGVSGTFQIEVKKTDAEPDKYVITVGDDAPIYRQVGEEIGELGEVGFVALQAGQRVEVWITGPVAESFPMQATAEFVVIVTDSSTP
jgi:hypothetical protein